MRSSVELVELVTIFAAFVPLTFAKPCRPELPISSDHFWKTSTSPVSESTRSSETTSYTWGDWLPQTTSTTTTRTKSDHGGSSVYTTTSSTGTTLSTTTKSVAATSSKSTSSGSSVPTASSSTTLTTSSATPSTTTTTTTTTMASTTITNSACPTYPVEGMGYFLHQTTFTFTGTALPTGLVASDNELIRDTDFNPNAPYNHKFLAENVAVRDGYLELIVPGAQTPSTDADNAVHCGQVYTTDDIGDILHASVRTHIIFSSVPGTIQSPFFRASDTQETDIELISDPSSQSALNNLPTLSYTNQPGTTAADTDLPAAWDSTVHEYRIDWTAEDTAFLVDGDQRQEFTADVPTQPGVWVWNNWSNGDGGFSAGPPAQDSVMRIQRVEMFYNTTTLPAGCQ